MFSLGIVVVIVRRSIDRCKWFVGRLSNGDISFGRSAQPVVEIILDGRLERRIISHAAALRAKTHKEHNASAANQSLLGIPG